MQTVRTTWSQRATRTTTTMATTGSRSRTTVKDETKAKDEGVHFITCVLVNVVSLNELK